MPSPPINSEQTNVRLRNDDGSETAATWIADTNVAATITSDQQFRARLQVYIRSTIIDSYKLQYSLNSGAWTDVGTASSVVKAVATASGYSNHDPTTGQLGNPGFGSFDAGTIQSNSAATSSVTISSGDYSEFEFMLQAVSGDLANGDQIRLRLVQSAGTALDAYRSYATLDVITANTGSLQVTLDALTTDLEGRVKIQGSLAAGGGVFSVTSFGQSGQTAPAARDYSVCHIGRFYSQVSLFRARIGQR